MLSTSRQVERFFREIVAPYEKDSRRGLHGPTDELVDELKALARDAGVLTPHAGAPDGGNMYLLGKGDSDEQKGRFLRPLVRGRGALRILL